jgi:DNA invertase Pin-like site-specific DNA recombinase
MLQASIPLRPRHPGEKLRVVVIGRISTEHQKEESIDASFRYVQDHLARIYDGPLEIECLGERASGMLADRVTIRRAEDLITSGRIDVVIAEDLSRIYRNPRLQYDFVQNAVDNGCRVICIADSLDTGSDTWELALGAAAFRHGMFIPDVRRRVRRSATHAFHNGGMVLKIKYGYRRLSKEEAASGHFGPKGLRIAKVAECTAVICQMCQWVNDAVSYVRISERLNQAGIQPGPFAKREQWSAATVVNLLRDPILSGTRRFRVVVYEPVYGTGLHRRRKGGQLETKIYPELAHLSVSEQTELWRVMDERMALRRDSAAKSHKRLNVPRSRSFWPGQSATCATCGGRMYDLGAFLKCKNALPGAAKPCWNHVQVPIQPTRQKTVEWLIDAAEKVPGAVDGLISQVWAELETARRGTQSEVGRIERRTRELQNAASNLAKAIAKGGELDVLVKELASVQAEVEGLQARKRKETEAESQSAPPVTREQLAANLKDYVISLLRTSYEFADVFRGLFSEFVIFPVQALDTPAVWPRGRLELNLEPLRAGPTEPPSARASTTLDLFNPPEHIRWLDACRALKADSPKLSLKRIAAQLGIGHMTVKRALSYARLMATMGLMDPYRELHERPPTASRWHRKRPRG